jgi:serine phosphatase RsbU (regulator of sigma subunit)
MLQYVNAGLNPPVVIRRDGSILALEAGGAPVGMFPDWIYEESVVQLHPGWLIRTESWKRRIRLARRG